MALIMVHFNVRWGYTPDLNNLSAAQIEDFVRNPNPDVKLKKKYAPIKFSTKIRIHEGAWSQKQQKAINNYDFVNKKLENIREIGLAIFNKLSNHGNEILISPEDFKLEWKKLYQPNKKTVNQEVAGPSFQEMEAKVKLEKSFTSFCYQLIARKKQAMIITGDTARGQLVVVRMFEKFQSEVLHKEILIGELNNEIIKHFFGWLMTQKKSKRQASGDSVGFRTNYISKKKSELKTFILHLQNEEELTIPVNTKTAVFKKKTEKTGDVALTKTQLKEMYHFRFSLEDDDFEELESSRDLFIIGCFLGGLRISDLNRLKKMHLKKEGDVSFYVVTAMHKKTRNLVDLPVHPYVLSIFQKYNNSFPSIHAGDFNKMIKKVGMRLGWNQNVEFHFSDVSVPEPVIVEKPFYSMLKSSTCRRTFATMMFKDGWALDDICPFSGHDSVTSLMHYIKYNQIHENVLKLHEKWQSEDW